MFAGKVAPPRHRVDSGSVDGSTRSSRWIDLGSNKFTGKSDGLSYSAINADKVGTMNNEHV